MCCQQGQPTKCCQQASTQQEVVTQQVPGNQQQPEASEPVHAAVTQPMTAGRATNSIMVIKEIKDISPCQETLMPTATAAKAEKPSPQKPDNYRQAQSKQRDVITSPQESDNHRQAQTKQRGVTTSPQESDNYRQAQSKQKGATTDPQPEANGTKKATEGESALYNQHTACSNNQVSFSTLTDVMLPSQSWTDAVTMPHNGKWGHVRDPGP